MSSNGPDDEISAGLGDYMRFKQEMFDLIPRVVVDTKGSGIIHPLARLNRNVPSDPTLAMIDAFAEVADVLSFYQDRVLNEGYLSTAIEYRSLALIGRGLGESPGTFIGATAEIAVFAQPGDPVMVPQGAAIQATPPTSRGSSTAAGSSPTGSTASSSSTTSSSAAQSTSTAPTSVSASTAAAVASAPVFETATSLTAVPSLNQLTPQQTRPAWVTADATELLLAGTGLGLQVGDFLLYKRVTPAPIQWVRLTVFSVSENHTLSTTTVGIGAPIGQQWGASGATDPLPPNEANGLELYAFDLTCRLFGYNAASWSSQSAAVQRANTPTGMVPSEYSEWPGYAIDLNQLDLQAVYPKVLPGSQFLLETPEDKTLGIIEAVSRQNISEFNMSGQVTEVVLEPDPATLPTGSALIPSRMGHSATTLSDGRVLLVGGIGVQGVLDSVEIYDPTSQLVSQIDKLPEPRALHTATMVDGKVYLAGGVKQDWSLAETVMVFDPSTMRFSLVQDAPLEVPRVGHAATLLPNNQIMLSGGLTLATNQSYDKIQELFADLKATSSVMVYNPAAPAWQTSINLARARAGHSATLCPVVKSQADGGTSATPPVASTVIFAGGHDGGAAPPGFPDSGKAVGTVWNDVEVTDTVAWQPTGKCYAIAANGTPGSARYAQVAVALPNNMGFLLTGGQSATGPVGDDWLIGAFADYQNPVDGGPSAVPTLIPAPALAGPRSNHAAALLPGNKVAVAGGVSGTTVLATVETFAVSAGVSIPFDGTEVLAPGIVGAPLPTQQGYPAFAALAQDYLLLAGGLTALSPDASTPPTYTGAVVALDADVGTMQTLPGPVLTTPFTLAPTGTILLADGTILIVGATRPEPFPVPTTSMSGFAWTFDPGTGLSTAAGAPLTPRIGATLSLLANGTVLYAGGYGIGDNGYAVLDTAEVYDPKSRTFRKVGNKMTTPRCGHSATVLTDGSVLLAGGFAVPPIVYDPPGVEAIYVPSLATAETFATATQAFTAITTVLNDGFALHSATLLANGDVLIAGGFSAFQSVAHFEQIEIWPTAQAAVFNIAAQAFATIAAMPVPRAMHSATLLPDARVLLAGGATDWTMAPTTGTVVFDPSSFAFGAGPSLSAARRSQGAVLIDEGVLMMGGDTDSTYEIVPLSGVGGEPAYPLPISLPSPDYPNLVSLTEGVNLIPLAEHGVYAFGGQVGEDGSSTCTAVLYVEAPPPADSDARRQALVYTQSARLYLAPPIDDAPLPGNTPIGQPAITDDTLVLTGLIDQIIVGQALLLAGNPPLARTVGGVSLVGGAKLPEDTLVMVYSPIPQRDESWWWANLPDTGNLSLETDPKGEPPSDFVYLSGNGTTIGNVTSDELALFTRPVQSEAVTVKAIARSSQDNTTTLTLQQPLRYLYDRTTTTVYGNVVEVTQGSTVPNEVLGSGDGQKPFQQFMLKQAPLTWLEDADGSIAPQLSVTVNGAVWQCVQALGSMGPDARAYQLTQDAQGRAQVTFGDGVHGLRPPTGTDNITATYRVGAGTNGNVAAGSITRAPMGVGGVRGVLNPVPASGGIGAPLRGGLRDQIPIGVADLGRIINRQDMVSFVLNRPEVGAAVLDVVVDDDTVAQERRNAFLLTLAAPQNGVPDMTSPAFKSLEAAVDAAQATRLNIFLLPFEPVPFKVSGWFTADKGADVHAIQQSITDAIRAAYALPAMAFDELVRASEIARIVNGIAGVTASGITDLWAPTQSSDGPPVHHQQVLAPKRAQLTPVTGAQILYVSADADAVTFTESDTGEPTQ
ncbi:hypothetical protein J2W22_004333 [Sphingomonas kyeonggiensis]|uniref:kelch repeat-containing protein n=1 Tax=Sphingomonas kyeonggiensis TaxID=1268553 RepID=UPI00277EDC04|nr:kelch repeat-containing protein [Sphingomonas kyeonggiensis]MDQ0252245.1 hypothetical protein [Sphingomonas kyeonggiensis]